MKKEILLEILKKLENTNIEAIDKFEITYWVKETDTEEGHTEIIKFEKEFA